VGRVKNYYRQWQLGRNTFSIHLQKMVYDMKLLKEPMKPLFGFGGKELNPSE
jgi:hypothetical protein